jgi:type I restriction enzyme S subunit
VDLTRQRAIAEYLDRETARIDALITKKQRMIELFKERRTTLISSAVSGDADLDSRGGGVTLVALKRALRPGGVSTGLIKGESSTEPDSGLVPGYSASGQDVWLPLATHFGPGLILSAVGARCGKVFQADGAWSVVANTVVLTPQPGHDVRFLWYLTNDENFWEKGGTAQPYVRVPDTLARKVWLPDLTKQRAIAGYLDRETARIDAITVTLERQINLLRERRQALITAAVTGEIEVPGVAE